MKLTFPPIGARIVKSSIAVGLCMVVYFIRTFLPVENGIPFYGALAALWCIQPYTDTTKNNALQRSVGTLIGAVYGLLFLLLFRRLGLVIPEFIYISASIFIIPVIYTTVVMNKRNASFFSCVVFLSIALTHSFDDDPYLFVLNRVGDTFIGIIIGVAVNDFRLPVRIDKTTLYVSGIDDVLISPSSNYSKVELLFISASDGKLICFRDLIAYRIVISMPACHVKNGEEKRNIEQKYLYEIADIVPEFLEERGFTAELSGFTEDRYSDKLKEAVRPYYRDYVSFPRSTGYQSIHITFYDNLARCYTELQLRTKDMDDFAEIGDANHFGYEKLQEARRTKRDEIPVGECIYFDEAYERLTKLQELELAEIDVNMFKAINNQLINDGCGLFRGRQILPFEHLSRFQNDLID